MSDVERVSYTVQQAAEATGLSVDSIRRAIRAEELTAHHPTSRPLVLRTDLEAWIKRAPTERATA